MHGGLFAHKAILKTASSSSPGSVQAPATPEVTASDPQRDFFAFAADRTSADVRHVQRRRCRFARPTRIPKLLPHELHVLVLRQAVEQCCKLLSPRAALPGNCSSSCSSSILRGRISRVFGRSSGPVTPTELTGRVRQRTADPAFLRGYCMSSLGRLLVLADFVSRLRFCCSSSRSPRGRNRSSVTWRPGG